MNYSFQKLFIISYTADMNPLANLLMHNVKKMGKRTLKSLVVFTPQDS